MRDQSKKFDAGKNRMELIPPSAIESLGAVLTYGALTYSDNSWQTVPDAEERYEGALMRHLNEYRKDPMSRDKESGLLHIEHVMCNAAFLSWFAGNRRGNKELAEVMASWHKKED